MNGETPVPVTGLSDIEGISTAFDHACAWLTDGTARRWGWNAAASCARPSILDR